jgi:hypothetical protein
MLDGFASRQAELLILTPMSCNMDAAKALPDMSLNISYDLKPVVQTCKKSLADQGTANEKGGWNSPLKYCSVQQPE